MWGEYGGGEWRVGVASPATEASAQRLAGKVPLPNLAGYVHRRDLC